MNEEQEILYSVLCSSEKKTQQALKGIGEAIEMVLISFKNVEKQSICEILGVSMGRRSVYDLSGFG